MNAEEMRLQVAVTDSAISVTDARREYDIAMANSACLRVSYPLRMALLAAKEYHDTNVIDLNNYLKSN